MAWKWQGKTYETRATLDEAKRRYYGAISTRYRAEHLARLGEDKKKVRHIVTSRPSTGPSGVSPSLWTECTKTSDNSCLNPGQ